MRVYEASNERDVFQKSAVKVIPDVILDSERVLDEDWTVLHRT